MTARARGDSAPVTRTVGGVGGVAEAVISGPPILFCCAGSVRRAQSTALL